MSFLGPNLVPEGPLLQAEKSNQDRRYNENMFLNQTQRIQRKEPTPCAQRIVFILPSVPPTSKDPRDISLLQKVTPINSCSRPRLWKNIPQGSKVFIPKPPASELQV